MKIFQVVLMLAVVTSVAYSSCPTGAPPACDVTNDYCDVNPEEATNPSTSLDALEQSNMANNAGLQSFMAEADGANNNTGCTPSSRKKRATVTTPVDICPDYHYFWSPRWVRDINGFWVRLVRWWNQRQYITMKICVNTECSVVRGNCVQDYRYQQVLGMWWSGGWWRFGFRWIRVRSCCTCQATCALTP